MVDGSGSDRSYSDESRSRDYFSSDDDSLRSRSPRRRRSRFRSPNRRSVRRRYDSSSSEDFRRTPPPWRNADQEEDRISGLPDPILVHILSFLPFIHAVLTATLSKRWRFLWKMVRNLVFVPSNINNKSLSQSMFSIIDKALLLHWGSRIDKFYVNFDYSAQYRSSLDVWLYVATGKNVEDINLDLKQVSWRSDIMYMLPQHLYTNSSLIKLTLRSCNMNPSAVISWPSLKNLSISDNPELNDNLIESVLSGTPALESLELRKCRAVNILNIKSASLKKLVIDYCGVLQISAPKVESLSILGFAHSDMSWNLPALRRATFNFELRCEEKGSCIKSGRLMTDLLETLDRIKELTLGKWCIQVLSALEVQNLTCPTLCTCKRLELNTGSHRWDLPSISNLLRSSESLETLVINLDLPDGGEAILQGGEELRKLFEKVDDKNYWNSQEGGLVNSLQCLKTIMIVDGYLHRREREHLLGLLQVLLKNARVLEKIIIWTKRTSIPRSMDSKKVAQRLLSFPKASPSAVILYHLT